MWQAARFGHALRVQRRRARFLRMLRRLDPIEQREVLATLLFWAKRERRFWWIWDECDPYWRKV